MYVNKYKDKFRAFERANINGQIRKVSVVIDRDTPQARKKAAALLQAKLNVPTDHITYPELVKLYIEYQKVVCKKSTWARNEASLVRLGDTFGPVRLDKMTAGYISSGLLRKTQNPGTYNEYLKRLKAMFRWAYRNDYIHSQEGIDKLQPLKNTEKKKKLAEKYLEPDELKLILANATPYYSAVFEFLALSGLRIGELIALNDKDISATDISVTKTYDFRHDMITTTKTEAGTRIVHIQPELRNVIRRIRANSKQNCMFCGSRASFFVVSPNGSRLSYDCANRKFGDLSERLIGRRLSLHALRHTHVALMAESGVSLDAIARRLGHSDSRITKDIYYHCTKKQRLADDAAFDAVSVLA